jgi:hypothetical protein
LCDLAHLPHDRCLSFASASHVSKSRDEPIRTVASKAGSSIRRASGLPCDRLRRTCIPQAATDEPTYLLIPRSFGARPNPRLERTKRHRVLDISTLAGCVVLAANLASLWRIARNLLRLDRDTQGTVQTQRLFAAWDHDDLLHLL